jgi:hypothetical protein
MNADILIEKYFDEELVLCEAAYRQWRRVMLPKEPKVPTLLSGNKWEKAENDGTFGTFWTVGRNGAT